jgi:hypothetical protein
MGYASGTAGAFEWLGLSWADRWLTEIGATTSALAAVHRLAAVDDLRTVDLAEEALRYGLMRSFLLHALLVRGDCVDLTPFEDGVPLGQLALVPVYCSDARRQWAPSSQWASKPHGPGCRHHRYLRRDEDLLTLGEWLKRLSAAAGEPSWSRDSCACSRCGGFALRRLDAMQLRYWRAVHEVYQAKRAVEEHEQHPAGAPVPDRDSQDSARMPALHILRQVGVVLNSYEDEPALAGYVKELRVRSEGLARRAE